MKTALLRLILPTLCLIGCATQPPDPTGTPAAAQPDSAPLAGPYVRHDGLDRDWPERVVYFQNGAVAHESLYLQDPYEYYRGNDGQFQTGCGDDLWVTLASPPIFAWNFVTLPATMVETAPFRRQFSRSFHPVQQPVHALPSQTSREITDEQIQDYFEKN